MAQRSSKIPTSVHSIRVPDRAWMAARRRAEAEGFRISHVTATLLEGYASGALHMPEIKRVFRSGERAVDDRAAAAAAPTA